ncbi:MAG: hypothetical protein TEF_10055 [Rhizobiales bacterium NRL2]|jgi:glutathione S-transferase|nr:MAG: hypothetical protein TEF_10055 [Rhizobiales bacterium NRL2]
MKLFQYPSAFGLTSPSPFCVKAEVLLRMAGLEYQDVRVNDPRKGPKGKLPTIEVDGRMIGDSELIRHEIEKRTGFDFDAGLDERERAVAHAFARMVEERLYWVIVYSRWMDDDAFRRIRKSFFAGLPPVIRSIVPVVARRQVRGYLHGQGLGRHSRAEVMEFGARDVAALASQLGGRDFMMGERPTSLDATAWAHLQNIAVPEHESSPLRQAVRENERLMAYVERGRALWFPETGPDG